MPDYRKIYAAHADRYHALVAAEDHLGNLPRALSSLVELRGARVVEMGMGTGRVTRELIDAGASVSGYDESPAMIAVARQLLGDRTYRAAVADVRSIELPERSADVAIAAWVLGHFCEWYADAWQSEIDKVLGTMWSALDDGGTLIVVETLGTGSESPRAPNEALATYYRHLEGTWGMEHQHIRTDYRFESLEAASASIEFFFGEELAGEVRRNEWLVVPECTGLWWRRKRPST